MIKKIKGFIQLSRWYDLWDYTLALTLLALLFSGNTFDLRFIAVYLANLCGQFFTFMINDVEDADDDAKNEKKRKRNPVSNKTLTKKEAYIASGITGIGSIVAFIILALRFNPLAIAIIAVTTIFFMFGYSYKGIRFKSMPVMDFLTHVYILAGAPYLLAYFCFKGNMDKIGLLGLVIVVLVSVFGNLENQIKDFKVDRETNINNTSSYIGLKFAKLCQILCGILVLAVIGYYIYYAKYTLETLLYVLLIILFSFLYPLIKYLITKDKSSIKSDILHALSLLANITLILVILKII